MGYYVSNMIGIKTGGVFAGAVDWDALKDRVQKVVLEMRADPDADYPNLGDENGDPSHCMSQELEAQKGYYVVLAGVFNYWTWEKSSEFSRRISAELAGHEVMHMCWDEEVERVNCQVWLSGKPLFETAENPIGRALRRVVA